MGIEKTVRSAAGSAATGVREALCPRFSRIGMPAHSDGFTTPALHSSRRDRRAKGQEASGDDCRLHHPILLQPETAGGADRAAKKPDLPPSKAAIPRHTGIGASRRAPSLPLYRSRPGGTTNSQENAHHDQSQ